MAEFLGDLAVGDRLPEFTTAPITRYTLALYCGASSDLNPIHVDSDFARAAGYADVFAHGMLGMAYLGHVLSAAVPLEALRTYGVRFVSITQVGDALRCMASVESVTERGGERIAHLSLRAVDQQDRSSCWATRRSRFCSGPQTGIRCCDDRVETHWRAWCPSLTAARRTLRFGNHVPWWRPGHRRGVRAGMTPMA